MSAAQGSFGILFTGVMAMLEMNYKTRGNSLPTGKPRVYFCSHPDDFDKYFEEISDDILEKIDCVVWYPENRYDDFDKEELCRVLKEIQLIVIPVTEAFLMGNNRAFDVEFAFAEENHIPILPLMQDCAFAAEFNEKCGDLQYLDKNSNDTTGISFDDKLEKYLNSVLPDEDQAEKIRAAFDAYIFLSYRKTDRKYAKELMSLIHRIDFCRDVAIWYDEFLTPGENFNDLIKNAIDKSRCFALTVTPNVVADNNYIITDEYPIAQKAGKPIVPVELVLTDRDELKKAYKDIPDCADGHDREQLAAAIADAISDIAMRENDHSPEHNFFIGLAYLGGIDVEVDHKRALELIESAARAGVPEAMEKLMVMYTEGQGVKRDASVALQWEKKLVDRLKYIADRSDDFEDSHQYIYRLWTYGDSHYYRNNFIEAEKLYKNLLSEAELKYKKFNEYYFLRAMMAAYNNLCDVYMSVNNMDKAKDCATKSFELAMKNADDRDNHISNEALLTSFIKNGEVFLNCNRHDLALQCYEKASVIALAILLEINDYWIKSSLVTCCINIGKCAIELKENELAWRYLEKALNYADECVSEFKNKEAIKLYITALNMAGAFQKINDNREKANELFRQAYDSSKDLYERYPIEDSASLHADSAFNMSSIYEDMDEFDRAREYGLEALDILGTMYRKVQSHNLTHKLSMANSKLFDVEKSAQRYKEAEEYCTEASRLAKMLVTKNASLSDRLVYWRTLDDFADLYADMNNLTKCFEYMEKSHEFIKETADIFGMEDTWENYFESHAAFVTTFITGRQYDKVVKYHNHFAVLLEQYVAKSGNEAATDVLITTYHEMAEANIMLGNADKAEKLFNKIVKLFQKRKHAYNSIMREAHISALKGLGVISLEAGKQNQAMKYLQKAMGIKVEPEDLERYGMNRTLLVLYDTAACVCERRNEDETALEYSRKAVHYSERSLEQNRCVESLDDMVVCLGNQGIVLSKLQDHEGAISVYVRAIELYEELLDKSEDVIQEKRHKEHAVKDYYNLAVLAVDAEGDIEVKCCSRKILEIAKEFYKNDTNYKNGSRLMMIYMYHLLADERKTKVFNEAFKMVTELCAKFPDKKELVEARDKFREEFDNINKN